MPRASAYRRLHFFYRRKQPLRLMRTYRALLLQLVKLLAASVISLPFGIRPLSGSRSHFRPSLLFKWHITAWLRPLYKRTAILFGSLHFFIFHDGREFSVTFADVIFGAYFDFTTQHTARLRYFAADTLSHFCRQ